MIGNFFPILQIFNYGHHIVLNFKYEGKKEFSRLNVIPQVPVIH